MKKFISMLAGVVMASSIFAASAYAATVDATVSATTVNKGDKVTVVLNKLENTLMIDSFGLSFNADEFELNEVYDVENYTVSSGDALFLTPWFISNRQKGDLEYIKGEIDSMIAEGNVSFAGQVPPVKDALLSACDAFATIEFTAIKEGTFELVLWEDSAGQDQFSGTLNTYTITVLGDEPEPEPDPEPVYDFGTVGNDFRGLGSKYWTVDYAAGEFSGNEEISLTDGEKTKTINVKTAEGFDIGGAVSFYVYVLGNDIANVYIVE